MKRVFVFEAVEPTTQASPKNILPYNIQTESRVIAGVVVQATFCSRVASANQGKSTAVMVSGPSDRCPPAGDAPTQDH